MGYEVACDEKEILTNNSEIMLAANNWFEDVGKPVSESS